MTPTTLLDNIETLFARHGREQYEGARQESVSVLEHALQAAQLAEWAHADDELVAAALLHDIGHLLVRDVPDHIDDAHELAAVPFLSGVYGPGVTEPIRLHVEAKRYLVRIDSAYGLQLSPASQHSLMLQGGPMSDAEMRRFEMLPHAIQALNLRRWDDLAKVPGKRTPPLEYYLILLEDLSRRDERARLIDIGAAHFG